MIEREHIGIFGKMNSGKSTVMNLLTQQNTSIVDPTPGTTADTKVTLMEIHGIGPVKLFDNPGSDEQGVLGEKKYAKVLSNLKECDLVLLIIDPSSGSYEVEIEFIELTREYDKQLIVVFNIFEKIDEQKIPEVYTQVPLLKFYRSVNIVAIENKYKQTLIDFIIINYDQKKVKTELLPFLQKDEYYILIIPMDPETPEKRFLRPQEMVVENITRNWNYPVCFRLDLAKARSEDTSEQKFERDRFESFLNNFTRKPKAIITDSQAMDIMSVWTPDDIMLTTFSIVMINYLSANKLYEFVSGIKALENLQAGDKILIAEACNHSRIAEDIGTVQIPKIIDKKFPGVQVEHNFGREFQENESLESYKLIIHCGGCMISAQKLQARLRDLREIGVPYTNYGVFLSYVRGKDALKKALEPFNVSI